MSIPLLIHEMYNHVADHYDARYENPESFAENDQLVRVVRDITLTRTPNTLDVGCGTGLALDCGITTPDRYTGIDPSEGMLDRFRAKHPQVRSLHHGDVTHTLAKARSDEPYDLVLAAFGVASYLSATEVDCLLDTELTENGVIVFMAYRGNYLPDYWTGEARDLALVRSMRTHQWLDDNLPDCQIDPIGQFDVWAVRHG